jgi:hypothetical protein
MPQFILDNIKKYESQPEIMLSSLQLSPSNGLNLEFGVFNGTSINLCSEKHSNRIFYGFDSFEGLPEDWREGFSKGCFSTGGVLPNVNSNVRLIKGLFCETLDNFLANQVDNVSFLHIDCDLYSSTKYVLLKLKDRLIKGTIILFDEFYNYPGYENGEYKAWTEFAQESSINFEYIGYNVNHEQVALMIA